ncbi:MAG TPA: hypothetical protein VK745_30675 [Polyangiaceae bacterium]|jgi:hypothetical protein|nr:hypothetical protein [Polyangiaceae bacterium]
MFEIKPSSEFSAWFESLSPAVAEEVACSLDLLAEVGTALGPSHASRALLWFDGVGDGIPEGFERSRQLIVAREAFVAGYDAQELLLWQREVVRCLESEAFRQRLAQLEPAAASSALNAVESLKRRLHAARVRIGLEAQEMSAPASGKWTGGLTPRAGRALRYRFGLVEAPEASLASSLKDGLFDVLRLVGLEPTQLMNSASGLCELTIASTEPRLHVLFGLDAPAQRIVVLLGEPLTRSYYGDSVKLAEQRWQEYCSADAEQLASL